MSQAGIADPAGRRASAGQGATAIALAPIWPPPVAIVVGWVLCAMVVANTVIFAARAANPLVISDGWYYLGSFVRKAATGALGVGDFFAKRTALDHSLPLHKLVLWINYRFFHLDFAFDAILGLGFAVATLLVIRRVLRRSTGEGFATLPVQVGFVALCAAYLSLNATAIYEWPLLTMGFCGQFFLVVLFVCSWHACVKGKFFPLVLLSALALVIADGGGIIAVAATVAALGVLAVRGWERRRALIGIGLLLATIVLYKIAYQLLAPPFAVEPLTPGLLALANSPHLAMRMAGWVQLALSSSLMHPAQTQQIFGRFAHAADVAFALVLVVAHAWFWWQALRRKPTIAGHVAVCVMLLFYGLWAGVLLARVPGYGDAVFTQPRYVIFYQLNIVALLMMAIDAFANRRASVNIPSTVGLVLASVLVLLVQLPLTSSGWKREPFVRRYVQQLAGQMDQLAADPRTPPPGCLPQLTVCKMPQQQRLELMALLRDRQLNLFSEGFRRRHGFAPASTVPVQ